MTASEKDVRKQFASPLSPQGIDDDSRKISLGAIHDGQFPGIIRFVKAAPFEYARPASLAEACRIAQPASLQRAMLITSALYAGSGLFFLATCRWLKGDMVAR